MNPHSARSAFTLLELLVVIVVLFLLVGLILPFFTPTVGDRGRMTEFLSNMKQLHLATQQMALDGLTTGNPKLNWPGNTDGTFSNWARLLVPDYLRTNDFARLVSSRDQRIPSGLITQMNQTALLVYAVKSESPNSTVFLSTANFTNTPTGGSPPRPWVNGKKTNYFVVFRKGGDGEIMLPRQAGDANHVGAFAPLCH